MSVADPQKNRMRPRRGKVTGIELLGEVFKSPTMIAVGLDPERGLFHAMIKTGELSRRWSEPLSPMLQAVFAAMRSMISA